MSNLKMVFIFYVYRKHQKKPVLGLIYALFGSIYLPKQDFHGVINDLLGKTFLCLIALNWSLYSLNG